MKQSVVCTLFSDRRSIFSFLQNEDDDTLEETDQSDGGQGQQDNSNILEVIIFCPEK